MSREKKRKKEKGSLYKSLPQLKIKRSKVGEKLLIATTPGVAIIPKEVKGKICRTDHGRVYGVLQGWGCRRPIQPALLNCAIESGPADPREDGNRMTGPLKLPGCNSERRQESLRSQ